MRDFGILNVEPVWEQQKTKLMEYQKLLTVGHRYHGHAGECLQ